MASVGDHRSFSELIFKFLCDGVLLYLWSFNLTLIVSLHFQTQNAQNISVLPSPPPTGWSLTCFYGKHFSSNVIRFTSKELLPSFLNYLLFEVLLSSVRFCDTEWLIILDSIERAIPETVGVRMEINVRIEALPESLKACHVLCLLKRNSS